jgi:hypothetical protein
MRESISAADILSATCVGMENGKGLLGPAILREGVALGDLRSFEDKNIISRIMLIVANHTIIDSTVKT